jgi:hydrogenase/urease accessory protein HupE
MRKIPLWGLALAAIATPALAHEGHHEQMPAMQALRHLVSQPDHQLAFAALVVLSVVAGWSWRRAKARK